MKNESNNNPQNEAMQYDTLLCTGLNNAAKQIHADAKRKGFWDSERETGTLLMLCVSELSEALEADRKDKVANLLDFENTECRLNTMMGKSRAKFNKSEPFKQAFEDHIKDSFEDELADTVIRILDLCGVRGINLEKHINLKLKYNRTRERMHGKNY